MKPDVYFFRPARDGLDEIPPWDVLTKINELLVGAGYTLTMSSEDSYAFDQTKEGIQKNGITYYTNSVNLQESVLADHTNREDHINLIQHMLGQIDPNQELLIVDPYVFPNNVDNGYIAFVEKIFKTAIGNISNLEVVTLPSRNQTVEAEFLAMVGCVNPSVAIRVKYTCDFHDRFWIADKERGIFVGTSLNGIGKRYTIADFLREQDVKDIYTKFQSLA